MWVAEAVNYRKWAGRNPGLAFEKGDRIVILADADQDGVCESSKVFAQLPELVAPLGIAVGIVHPGYVQTSMTGGHGDIDAATAAKQIIERIDQLDMARSGKFFHANGAELPW